MDERSLITEELINRVLAECHQHAVDEGKGLFGEEPLFQKAVECQVMVIIGRLVASGAKAELARCVASEIDRLVVFTAEVVRAAYQELLSDLMPQEDDVRDQAEDA